MNDRAAFEQMRQRERHILAAMDNRNRIKRLEWLLKGHTQLDQQTREFFLDMLAHERKQAKGETMP